MDSSVENLGEPGDGLLWILERISALSIIQTYDKMISMAVATVLLHD